MNGIATSIVGLISFVAATLAAATGASAQPADYYAGKTLRVIVGLEVGGSADVFTREFTAHLRKNIPGNPTIVVQNMPGGGTYAALNFLAERAAPDGLTIVYNNYSWLGQAFGSSGLRMRYDQFEFLGGFGDTRVNYMRTDAVAGGAKKPADIMKAENLMAGSNSVGAGDSSGALAELSLKVLGVKHKVIGGYRGGADIFLAMQRGEVQFHNTGVGTFRRRSGPFVKSGEGMGISYLVPVDANGEFERSKTNTEMPVFPDLYREIHGRPPSGPLWDAFNWFTRQTSEMYYLGLAPRGTRADALAALRQGFERTSNDAEFTREMVSKYGFAMPVVGIAQGQAIFRSLTEASPELLNTLRSEMGAH